MSSRNCMGQHSMSQNTMHQGCMGQNHMHQSHTYQRQNAMRNSMGSCREHVQEKRPMQEYCSMSGSCRQETSCDSIPSENRRQLLGFLNEVSFAAYEALLYLDTHPEDQEAMEYFRKYNMLRNRALAAYAEKYGPLTLANIDDRECGSWEWTMQPWPWELEGGAC